MRAELATSHLSGFAAAEQIESKKVQEGLEMREIR